MGRIIILKQKKPYGLLIGEMKMNKEHNIFVTMGASNHTEEEREKKMNFMLQIQYLLIIY